MLNRRMILVSESQNAAQHRVITSSGNTGGQNILDGKTQTVYTTSDKTTHFMSPIGSLQLTAEECNEILMKRAVAAVQANNHTITTTSSSDGHNAREFNCANPSSPYLTKQFSFSNFNPSSESFANAGRQRRSASPTAATLQNGATNEHISEAGND